MELIRHAQEEFKLIRALLISIFIFISCPYIWASPTYYLDPVGGSDSADGLTSSTPWLSCSKFTGLANGSDIYIKKGTTVSCALIVNWTGIYGDPVEVTGYGSGANPIFSSMTVQTPAWSRYLATAIYSSANTIDALNIVTQDGSRLKHIVWNTNIATTAALMSAGSFAHDDTNDLIYVWASDGSDPSSKIIKYAALPIGLYTRGDTGHEYGYLWLHDVNFDGYNSYGGYSTEAYATRRSNNSIVENCIFSNIGSSGLRIGGDHTRVSNNTCSYGGSEGLGDTSCFMFDGGGFSSPGNVVTTDMQIYGNTVSNQVNGSCYEMDFGIGSSNFYGNKGTGCTNQFLEVWSGSHSNRVFRNIGDNTGYPNCSTDAALSCRVPQGSGIKIALDSDGNLVYNNIMIGFRNSGYWTGAAGKCGDNYNIFFNNISINVDSDSAFYGFGSSSTCTTDNPTVYKNNIVKTINGKAFSIPTSLNTADYNDYSVVTTFGKYLGSDITFAQWQALGQDAHSITAEPNLKVDYSLYQSSPAINAGVYLPEVTDDYNGNPRIGADIGAFTYERTSYKGLTMTGASTIK